MVTFVIKISITFVSNQVYKIMDKRLQQFLELEDLTPSKLADILQIQRSGISHLLSGRNKPSFDFIQGILINFPQINPEWLILGKGKPYKSQISAPRPHQLPSPLRHHRLHHPLPLSLTYLLIGLGIALRYAQFVPETAFERPTEHTHAKYPRRTGRTNGNSSVLNMLQGF